MRFFFKRGKVKEDRQTFFFHSQLASNSQTLKKQAKKVSAMSELFKPCKLTRFDLAHKIVYAPLTRCRADGKGVQPKEAAT